MSDAPKTATLEQGVLEEIEADAEALSLVIFHRGAAHAVSLMEGEPVVVGRAEPADLVVEDPNLSRAHARFLLREDGVWLEDLGSTNGTRINGRVIQGAVRVGLGDGVRLGALAVAVTHLDAETVEAPRWGSAGPDGEPTLLGSSAAIDEVRATIAKVGPSSVTVLICGETGTGKELVARAIHAASPRRGAELRAVNCGALPPSLVMATLFGHERGAFTGAERRVPGLFEQADGSTLFLDEVGELSAESQASLLRVLETRTLRRVGGTSEVAVDVRVIAATHRDLPQMCKKGAFRSDLYYRLNTVTLSLPPLRARPSDIDGLATAFVREAASRHQRPVRDIAPDAMAVLHGHAWPGNARELRNTIERAVVLAAGPTITADDLPQELMRGGELTFSEQGDLDFRERIQRYEAKLMISALTRAGGNKTQAARLLRMPVRTFVHKFRAFGLRGLGQG